MHIPGRRRTSPPRTNSDCPTPEQNDAERTRLVGLCDRYLAKKNHVLWGRAFDLNDPASRERAAEWFAQEIESVFAQRRVDS